jgi:hypothetical protein
VATADINQLDIETLDSDGIAALIAAGEMIVERKERPPKHGLRPSIAAYANSGGGWLLVGVNNAGDAVGWKPPGNAELHDWLRTSLGEAIDPLALFGCTVVEHNGQSVVAIRIYPGNPPYVLRGSGSVYVRGPGGKNPIRTQAQLLEFVRQNGETEASALARLELDQDLGLLLHGHSDPPAVPSQTHTAGWTLIGTPQILPVDLAARALRGSTVQSVTDRLVAVLEENSLRPVCESPRPMGSAFVVEGRSQTSGLFMGVLVTASGTVAARLTESLRRPVMHTGQIADIRIASLLKLVFGTLTDLGATGRGLLHLSMRSGPTAPGARHVLTLGSANQGYEMSTAKPLEVRDEMLLPATDESIKETAERMMRSIARAAGIAYWDPEPIPGG